MKREEIKYINLKGKLISDESQLSILPLEIEDYIKGTTDVKDNSPYGKKINFEIVVYNEELSNEKVVGEICGRFFDIQKIMMDEFIPEEIFDEIDQYTLDMYEGTNSDVSVGLRMNIYTIDSIFIKKEFRNMKIGSCAILMLEEMLKEQFNRKIGKFVISSEPIWYKEEKEPDENELKQLKYKCNNFWRKLGFQYGSLDNFMFFNTDFDMRKIYSMGGNVELDYSNYEILSLSNMKSIYTYYNNKNIQGEKLNFDYLTKEELFIIWAVEEKTDSQIAKLFGTTVPKVVYAREKYGITKEGLAEPSDELMKIIRNYIRFYQ